MQAAGSSTKSERPFRGDFFRVVCDIECSDDKFARAMELSEEDILSFSFYQLHYLSRFARTEEQRSTMFNRVRRLWLRRHGTLGIQMRSPPETAAPVVLEDENHADRVHTFFTVLAQHCACPLDSEGYISFASDFTREAFIYQHEEPDNFAGFVDPAQRYRIAISDPLSWAVFQLKARIINRHLPIPSVCNKFVQGQAHGSSGGATSRRGRRRVDTTYAGYCDIFSISSDPASRAEEEIRRRNRTAYNSVVVVPSLGELVSILKMSGTGNKFAFACPARHYLPSTDSPIAHPSTAFVLTSQQNPEALRAPDEERFLVQLAYYHILETQRYYAQSRFAPWADEDTKPQLAALISRGQYYRSKLISWFLLPEDAPWVAPPALETLSREQTHAVTVDHMRTPRREAQTSFALNPHYNCATRVAIRTNSATQTEPTAAVARHYINKEQRAPEIILHSLFPHHYYRSTQSDDAVQTRSYDHPQESLLPGDTDRGRRLPPLYSVPTEPMNTEKLLKCRSVGRKCVLACEIGKPLLTTLHTRSFDVEIGDSTSRSQVAEKFESLLLHKFSTVLGTRPVHFKVRAGKKSGRIHLVCDDPAYLHYASLLSYVDDLLEGDGAKPFPLHPLLLRLFAVRPRRHNFEHYGWEGPANGFFDLAHVYCFARVLAHWCNRVDPYLSEEDSPDRYLCKPADSAEHFNHYLGVHKYIALFAAGDGAPVMDAIRERGLLANIGRFLTFRAAAYMHRDVYMFAQQWVQHQIAYSANTEFMRHHYWLLDHFSHPVEPLVCQSNPILISLSALCARHNSVNGQRMAVAHALDGRGAIPRSSPSDFAVRLYKAAIDMRFIHHKLAILLATSLANKPSQDEAPFAAFDLVVEPESCDHELLDWQQFRSTSWVRAFLAERAVADSKGGKFRDVVRSKDVSEFYAALRNISPPSAARPHAFEGRVHTQIDSEQAEREALRLLGAGGSTEEVLRASQDADAVLTVQSTSVSYYMSTHNVPHKSFETYRTAYFRRMLFLAYRMRLDPDLAVCMPPAQRTAFRVGEPATTQTRPWDPNAAPWDLESLTYTTGLAKLDPAIPTGDPRIPQPKSAGVQRRPNEADLAGVEPHLAVPLVWVHTIVTQLERMLPSDLQVEVLSSRTASLRYPESRFSPSYSVTVEEEKHSGCLVRLDACEMYMVYKAISHVPPEELTHDTGEEDSLVEHVARSQQERRKRRVARIYQDAVAPSDGAWLASMTGETSKEAEATSELKGAENSERVRRCTRDAERRVGFVLRYNDDEGAGVSGASVFADKSGVLCEYQRPEPRGCKRRIDSIHDTLDERNRPVAPSVRKYCGKQYKAYYVHNGLGAPSRYRVAFFCHGAYSLLIRACDRARFVEMIRRQLPYDAQLDFARLGYRILPVDRFREVWGLRRRVAYVPADEVAPPSWGVPGESSHTDLDVGVERAQSYGTWEKRKKRSLLICGTRKLDGMRASIVPLRAFKFPRRTTTEKKKSAGYSCENKQGYYTNPAAYWGLVDWMSAGGADERTGDFRMTGDADTLNPLLTVLAYLDAATVDMPEEMRANCAPIDYLEYDYLSIAGPGLRDLPIRTSPSGARPLTLSSCLLLKI